MPQDNCCPQKAHVECEREGHATGLLFQSASDKLNIAESGFPIDYSQGSHRYDAPEADLSNYWDCCNLFHIWHSGD